VKKRQEEMMVTQILLVKVLIQYEFLKREICSFLGIKNHASL